MKYRYTIPDQFLNGVAQLREFANGGMQVSIKTTDGKVHKEVLISAGCRIIAMRGYTDLPFSLEDIDSIYQTAEDINPKERGGWQPWDNFSRRERKRGRS